MDEAIKELQTERKECQSLQERLEASSKEAERLQGRDSDLQAALDELREAEAELEELRAAVLESQANGNEEQGGPVTLSLMQRGVGTLAVANSMLERFHDTVRGGLVKLGHNADSARER